MRRRNKHAFSKKSYSLSDAVLSEYKLIKGLYKRSTRLLGEYRAGQSCKKSVAAIESCLEFYEQSEKLMTALLTEILKSETNIRRKKAIFVLLNKIAKLFYLFDTNRSKNLLAFHDFAIAKQGAALGLHENEVLRLTSFVAIAMPMAHLFVSSFRSNNLELHIPKMLFNRNLIHLSANKKKVLRQICEVLGRTELGYIAVYFLAACNRFSSKSDFSPLIKKLDDSQQTYYKAMLLLN